VWEARGGLAGEDRVRKGRWYFKRLRVDEEDEGEETVEVAGTGSIGETKVDFPAGRFVAVSDWEIA
jgi:hypothetical protein